MYILFMGENMDKIGLSSFLELGFEETNYGSVSL